MPTIPSKTILTALFLLLTFTNPTTTQPTFSDNCQTWNSNNSVCQQCNPGFYLQFFFCIPCNPNCACSSKHDFCDNCLVLPYNGLNYHSYHDPKLDQCLLCNSTMPYCLECTNLQMCQKCWNGQYLVQQKDLDGIVIGQYCSQSVCQPNCQTCLDPTHCKQCQPGFYLFPNKTCSSTLCTTNCTTCSSPTQCSLCTQGYYLSNAQCSPCTSNCTQCTTSTNCQTCAPQFALENSTCTNTNLSNCVQYANGYTTCTGCEQGYEVTAGACNQCTGCNVCSQQFICMTPCLSGYEQFNFACIPSFQRNVWFSMGMVLMLCLLLIY